MQPGLIDDVWTVIASFFSGTDAIRSHGVEYSSGLLTLLKISKSMEKVVELEMKRMVNNNADIIHELVVNDCLELFLVAYKAGLLVGANQVGIVDACGRGSYRVAKYLYLEMDQIINYENRLCLEFPPEMGTTFLPLAELILKDSRVDSRVKEYVIDRYSSLRQNYTGLLRIYLSDPCIKICNTSLIKALQNNDVDAAQLFLSDPRVYTP
ncbi:hypothetical protein AKO1_002187, partial [Acrasis kona]